MSIANHNSIDNIEVLGNEVSSEEAVMDDVDNEIKGNLREHKEKTISHQEVVSKAMNHVEHMTKVNQGGITTICSKRRNGLSGNNSLNMNKESISGHISTNIDCTNNCVLNISMANNLDTKDPTKTKNECSINMLILGLPGASVLCIASTMFITLVPYHDVIVLSNYWYELIFPTIFLGSLYSLLIVLQLSKILNDPTIINSELLFPLLTIPSISIVVSHVSVFLVWSVFLGFNSPMPFGIFVDLFYWITACGCVLWDFFVRNSMNYSDIIIKLRFYCGYIFATFFMGISCLISFGMYLVMNEYFEWIAIIMLAISRKIIGGKMCEFISQAAILEKNLLVQSVSYIQESVAYKSFIVIILSTGTNEIGGYFFLGVPFFMNMYLCYQVILLHSKITNNHEREENLRLRRDEALMKLIVNELTEFFVPIIFVISIIIAYYGPNATLIGNVQNNYWQYHKIQDLAAYVKEILIMTAFDITSAAVSICLLWKVCNIV